MAVRIAAAAVGSLAVACGGSSGGGGSDASAGDASDAAADVMTTGDGSPNPGKDGGGSDGGDASLSDAVAPSPDGSADATAGDAGNDGGATRDGGADGGYACTVPTFATDCPPVACQTVTGCVGSICQYATLKVCPAGQALGTFLSGGTDAVIQGDAGTSALYGNIGAFRQYDGMLCQGTTCITGGIIP